MAYGYYGCTFKRVCQRKIDVLKTMTMLLIHDIVEIDAGDTYAYDEEAKKHRGKENLQQLTGYLDYCRMIRQNI